MYWHIVQKAKPTLLRLYRWVGEPPPPNLAGDRDIEYSWVVANMPEGPGAALDFGCGPNWMGLLAARKGFEVTALDLEPVTWEYRHASLQFMQGDIFKVNFPPEHFALIINCSAIEHVGLAGNYGIAEAQLDGDINAMRRLNSLLKPDGLMLLTIPVGKDKVFTPRHRIYGESRLPHLLDGWETKKKEYWIKDDHNKWICVEESRALSMEPLEHYYGLGLFVLRRNGVVPKA